MSSASHTLTQAQQAAVARIAYALESPSAVAILCGPAGVGKSTVLHHIAAEPALAGRPCERRSIHDDDSTNPGRDTSGDAILLLDDAHEASGDVLFATVERWRRREPQGAVVLTGEGRMLTLVAREARLERAVVLRAVLGPFTLAETRVVIESHLAALGHDGNHAAVIRTVHEIAAGIPARVVRLVELVKIVSEAATGGLVTPDDVEAVHRRLALHAA